MKNQQRLRRLLDFTFIGALVGIGVLVMGYAASDAKK